MRATQALAAITALFLIPSGLSAIDSPPKGVRASDQKAVGLTKVKEMGHGVSDALVAEGNKAYSQGDIKSAIGLYNQAIERSFLNATAYFNRATAYSQLSNFELAIDDFTHVLQVRPDFVPALHARAVAYRQSGNLSSAMMDHDFAIKLQHSAPSLFHNRALTLALLGRVGEAITDLSKAIQLDANFVAAYKARGKAYFMLGSYSKALSDFTNVLQLDGSDMEAVYNRGLVLVRLGRFDLAEVAFSIILRNNPDHLHALISRAELRGLFGSKQEALSDINHAVKVDPSSKKALQMHSFLHADFIMDDAPAGGL